MALAPFNRVVVTGVGAVTPLGLSLKETWDNIISGYSGVKKCEFPDHPKLPCKIAGRIPRIDDPTSISDNDPINNNNPPLITPYDPSSYLTKTETYYAAHAIQYALTSSSEAIKQAKLDKSLEDDKLRGSNNILDRYRIGVSFASGMGGLECIEKDYSLLKQDQLRKISPYSMVNMLINSSAGAISLRYGLNGPNLAQSTACAASAHSIQEGYFLISSGMADIVVCGGTESAITPLGIAGFSRCKALSTKYNDNPSTGSRPWDKNRDGFVMGEGSAALVLESETMAKQRGVKDIYGEIIGVAATADAFHVTSLDPAGHHVQKTMQLALELAKRTTKDKHLIEKLGYINAHATSTPVGDKTELKAILSTLHQAYGDMNYKIDGDNSCVGSNVVQELIRDNIRVSSTKSSIGHLLGASGAIEAVLTLQALKTGIAPPTLNLDTNDPVVPNYINLCPYKPVKLSDDAEYAMSNSFGFGGTNACIVFKKRDTL